LAEYPDGVQGVQYQAIGYSRDDGYTFEAYEGNPVLDINSTQFRDPYVIWHEPSSKWVMVLAYAAEYVIGVFVSCSVNELDDRTLIAADLARLKGVDACLELHQARICMLILL
jgi:sucrose-6-phosphate hydrolase SacC (GH32 family)